MTVEFVIPKLGDNVNEATIIDWLVDDGSLVQEGDEILEVETDKAVIPVPANASGTLRIGSYKAGDVVPIAAAVAVIEPTQHSTASADTGSDTTLIPEKDASSPSQAASGEIPAAVETTPDQPKATPVAQKMAADLGLDLQAIAGSGEQGKITKDDILQATTSDAPAKAAPAKQVRAAPPQIASTNEPAASTAGEAVQETIPLKGIRGIIARRMAESVHTTARVTLVSEVDATELVALREQLVIRYTKVWGFKPGYNDLLAMIVANALRQFPYMNARVADNGEAIEQLRAVNLGMAVDTERGLMVPVIRDADKIGLQALGSTFRELVERARAGKSSLSDLSGGTFTITSLGIYRVDAFTPIINLPEAAILGIGRIKEKPVVKDGEIMARKMMTLSLVFDHRLTDGAPAARFLDYICELIEEPYLLFLTTR